MKVIIFKSIVIIFILVFSQRIQAQQKRQEPNFLILLADDISATSLGCYGSDNPNTSPNIDQLAHKGIRFKNMFVSEVICAPTRA